MGEMEGWMDENFIKNVFSSVSAENVQVKVIRDRTSGYVCSLLFLRYIHTPSPHTFLFIGATLVSSKPRFEEHMLALL
jgi:hypothetical protein